MSLACFGLSAWFVFRATRRLTSPAAAALAVLVFALSPNVVSVSMWLSTEGPLYLATSAMMYYLFVCWTSQSVPAGNWIGLGLAVGLGFLSKASFAAIALPVLAFWVVVERWCDRCLPSIGSQRKAGILALVVAGPWWLLNIKSTVEFVNTALVFSADSLGPPSLATCVRWFGTVLQGLLGHGISILICLVAIVCFQKFVIRKEAIGDRVQKAALGACACAAVPIALAQLSSTNHMLRLVTPAVIPLAVSVGVLSDTSGWWRSRARGTISMLLCSGQLLMILAPVFFPNQKALDPGLVNGWLPWRVMARRDQLDWRPLLEISHRFGRDTPTISYIGNGPGLSPGHIQYPWVAQDISRGRAIIDYPDVNWLWRYEQGPVDWQKVMDSAGQSDIVLTAPNYVGLQAADWLYNQHNAEFAERLSRDARFQGPIRLEMGRFQPIEITVFLKKASYAHITRP